MDVYNHGLTHVHFPVLMKKPRDLLTFSQITAAYLAYLSIVVTLERLKKKNIFTQILYRTIYIIHRTCTKVRISYQEVLDTIKMIPTKRSSVGIDAISNDMIRHLPADWLSVLCLLFNKCWIEGKQPQAWKTSIVVPILKQGKPKQAINSYRPIALTSHVSKLMERVILNRLSHFSVKENVIPAEQAGFLKGRSTIDHLVKLTTLVKRQFARRKSVLATFFDIKKAYDQVWHARLLYKLKSIGLSGHMYHYIKYFLSNRKIQARIGTTYSSYRNLDMGIPQGSVIAPFLFILLINDLPSVLTKEFYIVQYADDLAI
jgi:hypothetical protein